MPLNSWVLYYKRLYNIKKQLLFDMTDEGENGFFNLEITDDFVEGLGD